MKRLGLLFSMMFVVASLHAAAFEKEALSRTTTVQLSAEKPLVVGNNVIDLVLTREGKVLSDATVVVKAFMPAMPGMPYMESKVTAAPLGKGHYRVELNFSMGGTWQIHVFVIPKEGKKVRIKTSVNL